MKSLLKRPLVFDSFLTLYLKHFPVVIHTSDMCWFQWYFKVSSFSLSVFLYCSPFRFTSTYLFIDVKHRIAWYYKFQSFLTLSVCLSVSVSPLTLSQYFCNCIYKYWIKFSISETIEDTSQQLQEGIIHR